MRGRGGFVRSTWDEVSEIIAAANVHTIKTWGPDRVVGFSPIPAMSMVSYASGARYLSLIGGTLLSFYDWYCDLPPSSPQTWGEQTDVPESADWYNSALHHRLGLERAADAHARCAFLRRGPLQRHQGRGDHARLRRSRQALRPLASSEAGHRRSARDGDGPRHPARILPRSAGALFPGLYPPLHRHADAGAVAAGRRALGAGSLCPAERPAGRAEVRPRRLEDGRDRGGDRRTGRAAGLDRLSLARRR